MLKSLINVEKKRKDRSLSSPTQLAQYASAGAAGYFCNDITPSIAQGVGASQRTGNSVKLTSMCLDIQFKQDSATKNQVMLRYYILNVKEANTTVNEAGLELLEPNPFSSVRDFHSNRDPEHFTKYRIIKSGVCKVAADFTHLNETSYKQIKIPLKLNHHLKYQSGSSNDSVKNTFFLLVVADTGNISTNTGIIIQYNARFYYTDN